MKITAFLRSSLLLAGLLLASAGWAQECALTTPTTALSGSGDLVTLTAVIRYDSTPSALGWTLTSSTPWELVSVAGANPPEVKPEAKSTGALEFAFTGIPEKTAEFTITVRLPAGTSAAKITGKAIVRTKGDRVDLAPAAIVLPKG